MGGTMRKDFRTKQVMVGKQMVHLSKADRDFGERFINGLTIFVMGVATGLVLGYLMTI